MILNFSNTPCISIQIARVSHNDWTQKQFVQGIFLALYSIIFILGVLGNIGIIVLILKRKSYKLPANLYLINLAFTEIMLCLTSLPATPYHVFNPEWFLGEMLCKLLPAVQVAMVLESSLSLCLIAVDRYHNITQIQNKHRVDSNRKVPTTICASWCLSVIGSTPEFHYTSIFTLPYDNSGLYFCYQFCSSPRTRSLKIYGVCLSAVQFALPLIVMSTCYLRVSIKVKKDMFIRGHGHGPLQVAAMARKRRVFLILVWMVTAFVLSWFPLSLVNWLIDFGVKLKFILYQGYFVQLFGHLIAMSSVVWIPLLYFWLSSSHLKDIKSTFDYSKRKLTMWKQYTGVQVPLIKISKPSDEEKESHKVIGDHHLITRHITPRASQCSWLKYKNQMPKDPLSDFSVSDISFSSSNSSASVVSASSDPVVVSSTREEAVLSRTRQFLTFKSMSYSSIGRPVVKEEPL